MILCYGDACVPPLDVDQMDESELATLGDEAAKLFGCPDSGETIEVLTLPAVVRQ